MGTERDDLRQLLDREVDGALDAGERALLEQALRRHPDLALERRRLQRLHGILQAERVAVRPGFTEAVLASLPPAPWQARRRAWAFPAAAMVALAALAWLLVGLEAERFAGGPLLGSLAALADFAVAAALSGAGLLAASWRGVGMALGEALSLPQQALFAAGVLALDLLLVVLLRRRRRTGGAEASEVARGPR